MNTKNFIQAAVLISLGSLTALPLYAQGKEKAVEQGVQAITKGTESVMRFSPSLYTWPAVTFQEVQQGVIEGVFEAHPRAQVSQPKTTTNTGTKAAMPKRFILVKQDPQISTLYQIRDERKHYKPEISRVRALSDQLNKVTQLTPEVQAELEKAIHSLPDERLRLNLQNTLQQGDVASCRQDLLDYYGLNGSPAKSSYRYLLRHPRQAALPLQSWLYSPLIDTELKQAARDLLSSKRLDETSRDELHTLLTQMHEQYVSRLRSAHQNTLLQHQVEFLQETRAKLEDFIAKNGHRPTSNTLDKAEMELLQDISWAQVHGDKAITKSMRRELDAINQLWEKNPPDIWSYEETLAVYEEYVSQTGEGMVPSLQLNPNLSPKGIKLGNSLMYWLFENPGISTTIMLIRNKYEI